MPEQPVNPYVQQPQQLPVQPPVQLPPQAMGGIASLTPQQEMGFQEPESGSFYGVSPEVLGMMWAPRQLAPQQQIPPPMPEELF